MRLLHWMQVGVVGATIWGALPGDLTPYGTSFSFFLTSTYGLAAAWVLTAIILGAGWLFRSRRAKPVRPPIRYTPLPGFLR